MIFIATIVTHQIRRVNSGVVLVNLFLQKYCQRSARRGRKRTELSFTEEMYASGRGQLHLCEWAGLLLQVQAIIPFSG